MTCKKKRLKCDETKPTCVQCEKRNVECEGYKKDYKWRSFEETNKQSRAGKAKKAQNSHFQSDHEAQDLNQPVSERSSFQSNEAPWSPGLQHAFSSATHAFSGPPPPPLATALTSPTRRFSPSQFEPLPILNPGFSPSDFDLPSPFPSSVNHQQRPRKHDSSQSSYSTGSPNLTDLLLPGTDLRQPPDPSELRPPMSPLPYQPGMAEINLPEGTDMRDNEEFDEEVVRQHVPEQMINLSEHQWTFRASSPAISEVSTASSKSTDMSILRGPALDLASPEMLMLRFDRETCGILSIKDGPSENPWRTLIWPLAKDSHALYHAISSMAALHGASKHPQLRLAGMAHMTKSISKLSAEMHQMSLDQALATALALALGEGWDDKISTGVQHLRGARTLLNTALNQRSRTMRPGQLGQDEAKRLRFLCNTYVYLDVIARLSSTDEQESFDLESVLNIVNQPFGSMEVEVDPLMGCATTLFPLIGKVASLIQRIRRTSTNSLNIVSEANELREQLLHWQPPNMNFVEQPEDPESDVRHAVQTAEAYRRATLLHLHQAVPELSSESSNAQAKNILTTLAGTPLSSRTLIVQIFPLLVGSCEMVALEDRQWVTQRWEAMLRRLSIVNVASCWDLVREVWRRRDSHIQEQARRFVTRPVGRNVSPGLFIPPNLKRKMPTADGLSEEAFFDAMVQDNGSRPLKRRLTFDASTGLLAGHGSGAHMVPLHRRHTDISISNLEPEYTVRGYLHWLGVMADWGWEGESSPLSLRIFVALEANYFAQFFLVEDDGDGRLLDDSFTLLYCRLLAARSFQRNSGEDPCMETDLSRYARMLCTYSSNSAAFCIFGAWSFVAGMVLVLKIQWS